MTFTLFVVSNYLRLSSHELLLTVSSFLNGIYRVDEDICGYA